MSWNNDLANFRMVPLERQHSAQVREWRNLPHIRKNMYTQHEISEEEHNLWFERMHVDDKQKYFVFFVLDEPVGVINFTQIDKQNERAYWGFYLGSSTAPRGTGSVMEFFALEFAFQRQALWKLCAEVLDFNNAVLRLHERFGFATEGIMMDHYKFGESRHDVHCIAMLKDTWMDRRDEMANRIFGKAADLVDAVQMISN